ncbi:hypothetical protein AB5G97_16475 [Aeromonas veronii]|uniref:hypothetical protein n=1 Tax=Aeromonas veronii TaxID=654 RepID=UPI00366BFC97
MVTGQTLNALLRGVSAEFGYYPVFCNIETGRFSIKTLPEHESIVAVVSGDPSVLKGWIYPEAQQHKELMSENVRSMPYNARVFGLPMTHVLTLSEDRNREELDFVVWCLSFFTGMRLTTTEASFLDATPIKPGKLVDFILSRSTITDVIELALDYLESERGDARAPKRVTAVIHALFLAQYPQNLSFERFQYLYMALDACFKLVVDKEKPKPRITHAGRVQWMCEKFAIPVPDWVKNTEALPLRYQSSVTTLFTKPCSLMGRWDLRVTVVTSVQQARKISHYKWRHWFVGYWWQFLVSLTPAMLRLLLIPERFTHLNYVDESQN